MAPPLCVMRAKIRLNKVLREKSLWLSFNKVTLKSNFGILQVSLSATSCYFLSKWPSKYWKQTANWTRRSWTSFWRETYPWRRVHAANRSHGYQIRAGRIYRGWWRSLQRPSVHCLMTLKEMAKLGRRWDDRKRCLPFTLKALRSIVTKKSTQTDWKLIG